MKETERLVALRVEGLSLRGIAPELGRAAPTISRELRRNALAKGGYPRCTRKAATPNAGSAWPSLSATSTLGASSATGLLEDWRPEQIAGWLRRSEERGWGLLATETIYAFVHRPGQNGEKLWRLLPRGVRGEVRCRARQLRSVVAERHEAGHGEGDLQICRQTRSVPVLKERKNQVHARSPAGRQVHRRKNGADRGFPAARSEAAHLITLDNDFAFARHHGLLASACAMATWFCDACAS